MAKLNKQQQQAHDANMDAAQRQIDERAAAGEDMSGAKINEETYEIVKTAPVDVSHLVEVKAPPTLEEQVKAIDLQLADTTLFPLVRDALTRVRSQVLRQRIHALQLEVRVLRNLMPPKQKRAKKA